ncbi:unannotated protein [freshwater metagenome]|uniref:Unannotated protein n=1 Tax=freshwater metagenome TaxID=449393 RepID=A0A6J7E3C8_9ZZZZ|nr:hypothetical protein [Actinomycetota bacterium]
MSGVFSPTRAKIKERTLRTDRWWLQPAITVVVLVSFIIYATIRAFENKYYFVEPLVSPFYSPCLSTQCVEGSSLIGQPFGRIVIFGMALSPALLILIFPLGFRMTCYYYRKAYYRAFWMSPPACAVAEPHTKYTGETRAPLILQNAHRWFFYAGLIFNVLLTVDAVLAFRNPEGEWGHMSVGSLVLLMNATLLWLYSASCHTCRHTVGGRLKHFSKHPIRYKFWSWVSVLNHYHPTFAWISLFGVALSDVYVRAVASGAITNFQFF